MLKDDREAITAASGYDDQGQEREGIASPAGKWIKVAQGSTIYCNATDSLRHSGLQLSTSSKTLALRQLQEDMASAI
jgi:hypothetical protein